MMTAAFEFRRYSNAAELAHVFGPCPRSDGCGAMVTGTVWLNGRFLVTCDSERCIAHAMALLEAGKGV